MPYLVGKEDPLGGMEAGRLDPGVARKVDRTTGKAFHHDALQEELPLVAVQHCDGACLAEAGVHCELRRVHHPLRLRVLLLKPSPQLCLVAAPWLPRSWFYTQEKFRCTMALNSSNRSLQ